MRLSRDAESLGAGSAVSGVEVGAVGCDLLGVKCALSLSRTGQHVKE